MSGPGGIAGTLREGVFVCLRPYWGPCGALLLFTICLVAIETAIPLAIRFLVDTALIQRSSGNLVSGLLALGSLTIAAIGARLLAAMVQAHLHKEVFWDLDIGLFESVSRLPISYFDRLQPGHFGPIFDHDVRKVAEMTRDIFSRGVQALLQFVVLMGTMLILNWPLALIVLGLLPLAVLRSQRALRASLDAYDLFRTVIAKVNGHVQDFVSTQVLTRAFGREEVGVRNFVEQLAKRSSRRDRLRSASDLLRTLNLPHFQLNAFRLSMNFHKDLLTLVTVSVGVWMTYSGRLTLGTFSAFILMLPAALAALGTLAQYVHDLGQADQSFRRIASIRGAVTPKPEPASLVKLERIKNAISFHRVEFGYVPERPMLRDINLTLATGNTVAFVGRSGAGKTTLFKLMLGLYAPTAGEIRLDGHPLDRLSREVQGTRIGTVLQASVMINATIRENICFAKPDATEEEMIVAARAADIHDFIASLPDGYASAVGEDGKWLSEGQKQRIALARAILPKPDLLLLDEVTASLDPETEASVNATIADLANETTIMIVSHRLSSVRFADHIVVMDQGRIREQGQHDHLLKVEGLYSHFWQLQNGFNVSGDGQQAQVSGRRLKAIPLFKSVKPEALDKLAALFMSQTFESGQPIYREGDAADKFYILVRGSVSITSRNIGNQAVHLADFQDGDYFGEMEMINRGRRTTSVISKTPCLVLALYAEQFDDMADENGSLGKIVTQMALGRSLSTISIMGRRRRKNSIWKKFLESTLSKA